MLESDIERLDLNLLRVLQALIATRSVTRAGESLGLSQPATSRAVAKLRKVFGDPLLVRTSEGYVLTPLAESLSRPVADSLLAARQVFSQANFDSATSSRCFRMATTDYGALAVVAPVLPAFAAQAPGCTLTLSTWSDSTLSALESGKLDFACYANDALPQDFHSRDLFVETYVALVRTGHPLSRSRRKNSETELEALAAYPQIAVRYPSGRTHVTDDLLGRLGAPKHHLALTIPYFSAAPWMLRDTDAVLIVPSRVAALLEGLVGLETLTLAGGERFTYRMVWHERAHRDAGVSWIRGLCVSAQASTQRL